MLERVLATMTEGTDRLATRVVALTTLAVLLLAGAAPAPLLAQDGTITVRVEPATQAVPVNGTFTVDIVADLGTEMDASGLGAYEFDLVDALGYTDFVSAQDAGDLGSTGRTVTVLGPETTTNGELRVSVGAYSTPPDDVDGPKGDGVVLATVELHAKRAGVVTLELDNVRLADTVGNGWPDAEAGQYLEVSPGRISVFLQADFDGDGKADPAGYRGSTGRVEAYLSHDAYAKFEQWIGSAGDVVLAVADYDGDGKADPAAFRPSRGSIIAYLSASAYARFEQPIGPADAKPAVGDYDGDGLADPAAFDPSSGFISAVYSSEGYSGLHEWWVGPGHAIPVVGDYDGDGLADPAAYADGAIVIRRSGLGYDWFKPWVGSNATPLVGDYDGDGKDDPAAYRPWDGKICVRRSSLGHDWFKRWVGMGADIVPLVADYDSDGRVDLVAYRGGEMLIRRSSLGYDWWKPWIGSDAIPMVGDYDGDGLADPAALRPDGKVRVRRSTTGYGWNFLQWIGSDATPVDYWQVP